MATFVVAIAGKWLVAGRMKAGRFPLWGVAYFRWWLADQLCELPPLYLLSGTPLLVWYLRALGARIGRDVLIDSVSVRVPDLLTIESGVSVGTAVHIENARVEGGELVLGPVHLGRDAVVDSYAVLENDTAVGTGARLGGLSALAAGRRVPAGEIWEGAPARRVRPAGGTAAAAAASGTRRSLAQLLFFVGGGTGRGGAVLHAGVPSFMLIDWVDEHLWDVYEKRGASAVRFRAVFSARHSRQHGAGGRYGVVGGRAAAAVLAASGSGLLVGA